MIGKEGKGFFAAHWDWLVAGLGAASLVAGIAWFALEAGVSPEDAAADEASSLDAIANKAKPIESVDMAAYGAAMKMLESPSAVAEISDAQGSFLASARRVFCEQVDPKTGKPCGKAIPFGMKTCPFCAQKQPEEQKPPALDSDGDGIPDEVEVALGLNPNDPSDAAGDLDGDGFTNLEELQAKTDPKDAASHPDYIDSIRIEGEPKATHTTFVFNKGKKTPGGVRLEFLFPKERNDWGKFGKLYSVAEGERIAKTGFVAKSYEEKFERVPVSGAAKATKPGEKVPMMEVDRSVATVVRERDGKVVRLVAGDRRYADVDVQATLVCDRDGGRKVEVVTGSTFEIRGEKFVATDVAREGGSAKVTLKNMATGATKTL